MKKVFRINIIVLIMIIIFSQFPVITFASDCDVQEKLNLQSVEVNENKTTKTIDSEAIGRVSVITSDDSAIIYDDRGDAYCDGDIDGISFDSKSKTLTLNGYNKGQINVSNIEDLIIDVKKASTINYLRGSSDIYEDVVQYGLLSLFNCGDVTIKGNSKLTLKGKALKVYRPSDEGDWVYWKPLYGLSVNYGNLFLASSNIEISNCDLGVSCEGSEKEGNFEMSGGIITIKNSGESAFWCKGSVDIHEGIVSGGNSFRKIDAGFGTYTVIGKSGAYYNSYEGKYNSKVARTVTIKGGNALYGECDNFKWSVKGKGLLTVTGDGDISKIGNHDVGYPWDKYCDEIKRISIGAGITEIGDAFEKCRKVTSISVDSKNANYASIKGTLFNKDKSTLISYPTGKAAANYEIPAGVIRIGNSAFANAKIKTLTLSKSLNEDICNGITNATINAIKVKKGNTCFYVTNNVLYFNDLGEKEHVTRLVWYGSTNKNKIFTIPDGVNYIDNNAFILNSKLRSIYIPTSVTGVGTDAFNSSVKLDVLFMGDAPKWPSIDNATFVYQEGTTGWDSGSWKDSDLISCQDVMKYYPTKIYFENNTYEVELDNGAIAMNLCWDPKEANVSSFDYTCSDEKILDLCNEGPIIYADALKAGTFTVTATIPNGKSCKCKVIVKPYFEVEECNPVYIGNTYANKLVGTSSGVKWSSSNKKVATVSTKGVVTGKGEGKCTIRATFQKNTYSYDIEVNREYPGNQLIYLTERSGSKLYADVENNGETPITISTGKGYLLCKNKDDNVVSEGKASVSKVTIKPRDEKTLTFKISGKYLGIGYNDIEEEWYKYDFEAEDMMVFCNMTLNGITYPIAIDSDGGYFYKKADDKWYKLYDQ